MLHMCRFSSNTVAQQSPHSCFHSKGDFDISALTQFPNCRCLVMCNGNWAPSASGYAGYLIFQIRFERINPILMKLHASLDFSRNINSFTTVFLLLAECCAGKIPIFLGQRCATTLFFFPRASILQHHDSPQFHAFYAREIWAKSYQQHPQCFRARSMLATICVHRETTSSPIDSSHPVLSWVLLVRELTLTLYEPQWGIICICY